MAWVLRRTKRVKHRTGVKKWRRLRRYRKMTKRPAHGFLKLVRKLPIITSSNTLGVVGGITTNDPTSSCLTTGTPVAKVGYNQIYDIPFVMSFQFDQMVNSGELIAIGDQYKIVSNLIKLECPATTSQMPGGNATPTPYLEYIQDYDDNVLPNVYTFREKMGIKTKFFSSTRPMIRFGVRPRAAQSFYRTAVSTGYAVPGKPQYFNMSYADIPHYGIKGILRNVWLPAVANSSPFTFDISTKVYIKDIQ